MMPTAKTLHQHELNLHLTKYTGNTIHIYHACENHFLFPGSILTFRVPKVTQTEQTAVSDPTKACRVLPNFPSYTLFWAFEKLQIFHQYRLL